MAWLSRKPFIATITFHLINYKQIGKLVSTAKLGQNVRKVLNSKFPFLIELQKYYVGTFISISLISKLMKEIKNIPLCRQKAAH